jgi:ATP-binding cassette subfamily F protein uup
LLIVSHDRAFLDNVVTSTFVFEGDGQIEEYVGGYEDWVRQRAAAVKSPAPPARSASPAAPASPAADSAQAAAVRKLSYREQREFEDLPARIESLEAEQRDLNAAVQDPLFYTKGADAIQASLARLEAVGSELLTVYARWGELDARASRSSPAPSSTSRSR